MMFDQDQQCSFLCIVEAGCYIRELTIIASKGTSSRLNEVLLQSKEKK